MIEVETSIHHHGGITRLGWRPDSLDNLIHLTDDGQLRGQYVLKV